MAIADHDTGIIAPRTVGQRENELVGGGRLTVIREGNPVPVSQKIARDIIHRTAPIRYARTVSGLHGSRDVEQMDLVDACRSHAAPQHGNARERVSLRRQEHRFAEHVISAVSYTHLTLPTKRIV